MQSELQRISRSEKINRELSYSENSSFYANIIAPHNCVCYVDFSGSLEKEILHQALNHIQKVFPCLTCRIDRHGSRLKLVSTDSKIPVFKHILEDGNEFDDYFEREINLPFNLWEAPLIRVSHLVKKEANRLLITIHHMVCDGISLSNFVEFLFNTIESIKKGIALIPLEYEFQKLEDLLPNEKLQENSRILELENHEINLAYGYTKAVTFTLPKIQRSNSISLTYFILAAAGLALNNITSQSKAINYVIPVDMRAYCNQSVSQYQLGFYCSWINFDYLITHDRCFDLAKDLGSLTKSAIKNNEHFKNLLLLKNIGNEKKSNGIIKSITNTTKPSLCVSNVGNINIRASYLDDSIKIKSIYFGLNTYYRANNCFLLIANGLGENLHFSLLYSQPYLNSESAIEIKNFISNILTTECF